VPLEALSACGRKALRYRFLRLDWAFWLPVLAAGIALFWQLAWKPIVGIADNGDFGWLSDPFGLQPTARDFNDRYYHYVVRNWTTAGPWRRPDFLCASVPLVIAAWVVNALVSPPGLFDLRAMGLVQAALVLGGLGLLLRAVRLSGTPSAARALFGLLAPLMLCDTTNVIHLNSFLQTGGTLVFSGWMVGAYALMAADGRLTPGRVVLALVASCLFLWSKPQLVPVGFLSALLLFRSGALLGEPKTRRLAYTASALLVLASIAWAAYPRAAGSLRGPIARVNLYHAVFTGLLEGSPDPAGEMAELGVTSRYAQYIGKSCLDSDLKGLDIHGAEWRKEFFRKVGYGRILFFYLRHPGRLWLLLSRSGGAWDSHPSYGYGMYEKESVGADKHLLLWRRLRSVLPHSAAMGGVLSVLALAGLLGRGRARTRGTAFGLELFVALCAMSLCQFVLVPITSGLPEVERHLYPFQLLLDWALIVAIWLGASAAARAVKGRREAATAGECPAPGPGRR
jgi:hypothetical protein